jgi:hypothetical protein
MRHLCCLFSKSERATITSLDQIPTDPEGANTLNLANNKSTIINGKLSFDNTDTQSQSANCAERCTNNSTCQYNKIMLAGVVSTVLLITIILIACLVDTDDDTTCQSIIDDCNDRDNLLLTNLSTIHNIIQQCLQCGFANASDFTSNSSHTNATLSQSTGRFGP